MTRSSSMVWWILRSNQLQLKTGIFQIVVKNKNDKWVLEKKNFYWFIATKRFLKTRKNKIGICSYNPHLECVNGGGSCYRRSRSKCAAILAWSAAADCWGTPETAAEILPPNSSAERNRNFKHKVAVLQEPNFTRYTFIPLKELLDFSNFTFFPSSVQWNIRNKYTDIKTLKINSLYLVIIKVVFLNFVSFLTSNDIYRDMQIY